MILLKAACLKLFFFANARFAETVAVAPVIIVTDDTELNS